MSCLARPVRERPGEEGLAGAGDADEERIDALGEKAEVVQREVACAQLLADGVEVEVETVDGIELGELGVLDAAVDGALHPAGAFLVAQAVDDVERGQVVFAGALEELRHELHHAGQAQPAKLLEQQVERVVVIAFHGHPRRR